VEAAFFIRAATPPLPWEVDAILRRDGGNFGGRKHSVPSRLWPLLLFILSD